MMAVSGSAVVTIIHSKRGVDDSDADHRIRTERANKVDTD
jgi:hypothetical protein